MEDILEVVVFELAGQSYALDISNVEQIVQIVEVSSLPEMPDYISGVINFHGDIIPVLNMHFLFNRIHKEIELSDKLIIVNTQSLRCALWVDKVNDVISVDMSDTQSAEGVFDEVPYFKTIIKNKEGMTLISDVNNFFNLKELQLVNRLLKEENESANVNM